MEVIQGENISDYIERLGKYRIDIFKEYPYLYQGDMEYEQKYLSRYTQSHDSILLICSDRQGITGAATGIPLKDEDNEFKSPFADEDLSVIFYIGEIMIRQDSRGKGLGTSLLSKLIELGTIQNYQQFCLYTVQREVDHPLKPADYRSPDNLWTKFGFRKDPRRLAYYPWKDVGEAEETVKAMNVWIKELFRRV